MHSYILRRLLFGILIIWGVYTLTFFAVNLAPGDPFANLENPKMQKEDLDRLRRKWGYDKPLPLRYVIQLRKMFWADQEVLTSEAGGMRFDVQAVGDGNGILATRQEPPESIEVRPTEEAALDGVGLVTVRPGGGGVPIQPGMYRVGRKTWAIRDDGSAQPLVTQGLRLEVRDGLVRAEPVFEKTPGSLTLQGQDGVVEIPARAEGRYGPQPLRPGRYVYGDAEILIPPEQLDEGGLTFDLGKSVQHRERVTRYLAQPLVNTLLLAGAALFIDFLIGILVGVVSAIRPHSKLDHALTLGSLFVYSMPGFWLALMLVLLFSVKLQWLPAEGMHDPGQSGLWDLLKHMILPVSVLGIAAAASTARYQRSALLEVLDQDYIRTARAKGLDERTVIWKHAMRNSLLPVITLVGLSLPFLVSGAVITEKIFSWPGMGSAVISAISSRDVFVLTGITLISTTMVVLGNLLADVLYAFVDPRVRLE